jgi:SpoVK/Ycf46/Vps4 family AAA+-type ATPase|tara:strand:- start:250 stop:441 length:192 start_codon:yes stop_codon:yes gene_type:complete
MPKFKQKSPVDSIIVDMILDHYNIQNLSGKKENLTGEDFNNICKDAEKIYFKTVLITKEPGVA